MADFIWYELMTSDPEAATRFYGEVVGWTVHKGPPGGPMDYRLFARSDGGSLGGMLALSPEMVAGGARGAWVPYLHAENVDVKVAAIIDEGGDELMPAFDLPVGRIAMLKDPQGAAFYVMTPVPPPGMEGMPSDVFSVTEPQHVRWNELTSPDQLASMDFYRRHFGFTFDNFMPMGELGEYRFIEHDGRTVGAVMQQPPGAPTGWQMYFGVPSITEARGKVEAAGGTVLMGPHEIPGGEFSMICADPLGTAFGLVGPDRD